METVLRQTGPSFCSPFVLCDFSTSPLAFVLVREAKARATDGFQVAHTHGRRDVPCSNVTVCHCIKWVHTGDVKTEKPP